MRGCVGACVCAIREKKDMNPKRDGESMQSTKAVFYRRHKAGAKRLYSRFAGVRVYAFGMELSLFRGFVNNQLFSFRANIHRVERRIRVGGVIIFLSWSYMNHQKAR